MGERVAPRREATAEEAADSQAWVAEVTERAQRGEKDEKADVRALFFEELRKLNLR